MQRNEGSPKRIQLKRTKGDRKPEGAVVVSRPSKWRNPFLASVIGNVEAVRIYRECIVLRVGTMPDIHTDQVFTYPADRYGIPTVAEIRAELVGRDLACWCPLEDADGNRVPCHADVLLAAANPGWKP